jgi:hypothetical protein
MLLQLDFIDIVVNSFTNFFTQLGSFLPRLLGAMLILVVGWIVARWGRKGASKGLKAIRFDELAKNSGMDDLLKQGDVPLTTNGVLSGLVYWILMLFTILAAIDSLGLAVASELFNGIVLYLPNVVVAVVILILGGLFAKLIRGTVSTVLVNAQVEGAKAISAIAYYAVVVFAVSVALVQLQIGRDLVLAAFRISFGALAVATALAFGLGGREWAARVIDKTLKKP